MSDHSEILEAITVDFPNIYLIDLTNNTGKIIKQKSIVIEEVKENPHNFDYESAVNKYAEIVVHPEDKTAFLDTLLPEQLKQSFACGKSSFEFGYRIQADEEAHYYGVKGVFSLKGDGSLQAILLFQNIDEIIEESRAKEQKQKEVEDAYKEELETQVKILNNLTRDFRNVYIADMNKATAKILKVSPDYHMGNIDDLRGKTFPYQALIDQWCEIAVVPEDRERMHDIFTVEHVREAFKEQDELTGVYRSLENGAIRNYQYNISKLDQQGDVVVVAFQIIDSVIEQHLAEEKKKREVEEAYRRQLIIAKNKADQANSAKTKFLLRMSHDLRTPLNGITGMLDIADRFPESLEKQLDCRRKIRSSLALLLALVNEVLDLGKLESGEIILESVPFNADEILNDILLIMEKQAEEYNVEVILEEDSIVHTNLIGSPIHCKRLMMNLISNAIKYNKNPGKVFVSCKELSFKDGIATMAFTCRDTGIGMSEEFQKEIFEPFAQENALVRTSYEGTGLGLPITKKLVEIMGGSISFVSTQGVGSTFEVVIPFKVDASDQAHTEHEQEEEQLSIEGTKILLVEDNDLNMEIAQFILEEKGAQLTLARDGAEAVEVFKQSEAGFFDAILMDVMMPVMNGYEATKTIRALDRADAGFIPIIAMTANAFVEDKVNARRAGMNGHVAKPIDVNLLIKTLVKLTDGETQLS